ncbi:hypothetical protein Pmani_039260 [Petrolisthes manimaculis]|uniref:Uncharacterized protein n=1 Tax=Petrolisthes manimaculis TaxID=1843537 RepID=A0AAE1ND05_9EUCA|nr:hypothetical protein Pmani_039260 [Petrolisthes manimaculis]
MAILLLHYLGSLFYIMHDHIHYLPPHSTISGGSLDIPLHHHHSFTSTPSPPLPPPLHHHHSFTTTP